MSVLGAEPAVADVRGTAMTGRDGARRVAVIGGGIAGLASAHFLLQRGWQPVVLEATEQLGGLGTHFEHQGVSIDRFYHVILDSDADLCGLMADIGIGDRLVWRETGMGFLVDGTLYPFNSPADLLRFGALGLVDRLRTGFGALYITSLKKHALDLDGVPARDWLLRLFGPRVFQRIWDPLLRSKFGDDYIDYFKHVRRWIPRLRPWVHGPSGVAA